MMDDPRDTLERVRRRISTDGVEQAYEALIAVCRNEKAAPNARATAGSTIFRAAGLLNVKDDGAGEKDLAEMSLEELRRAAAEGEARIAALERAAREGDGEEDGESVFD